MQFSENEEEFIPKLELGELKNLTYKFPWSSRRKCRDLPSLKGLGRSNSTF